MQNGYVGKELRLRNNEKMRTLFCEIVVVLCLSKKKHSVELIKLNKKETFELTKMNHRFKADKTKLSFLLIKPFGDLTILKLNASSDLLCICFISL